LVAIVLKEQPDVLWKAHHPLYSSFVLKPSGDSSADFQGVGEESIDLLS